MADQPLPPSLTVELAAFERRITAIYERGVAEGRRQAAGAR